MVAQPYRAAVIGRTGRGDYGHGLDVALLDQPKLQVVAVADENVEGLAKAAKRLRVEKTYGDYREMLRREKPQFVVVGPRWLDGHKEMILACAENGVRGVFCEKPMAPDLASCDAIVDACDRTHMKLAMAFQTRYSPRYERIKALIAEGAIGEVLELRGRGKEDRRGGGEDLMVLGVHILDLCHDLLGEPACGASPGSRNKGSRSVPTTSARARRGSARSRETGSTHCSAFEALRPSRTSPRPDRRSPASGSA